MTPTPTTAEVLNAIRAVVRETSPEPARFLDDPKVIAAVLTLGQLRADAPLMEQARAMTLFQTGLEVGLIIRRGR